MSWSAALGCSLSMYVLQQSVLVETGSHVRRESSGGAEGRSGGAEGRSPMLGPDPFWWLRATFSTCDRAWLRLGSGEVYAHRKTLSRIRSMALNTAGVGTESEGSAMRSS